MRSIALLLCLWPALALLSLRSWAQAGPAVGTATRLAHLGTNASPNVVAPRRATDVSQDLTLVWSTRPDQVQARIVRQPLSKVLNRLAKATGWQVFAEPGADPLLSTTFFKLPAREALSRIFQDINYVLLPPTNGRPRLVVFRTAQSRATREIDDGSEDRIREELVVRLGAGSALSPEELAKLTGGEIAGQLESLKAVRLKFPDAEAAEAARKKLADLDGVTVEDNYRYPGPESGQPASGANLASLGLKPAPVGTQRLVIGLIDTAVQPLGPSFDAFLVGRESVVPGSDEALRSGSLQHGTSMFANLLRSAEAAQPDGGTAHFGVLSVDVYGTSESTSSYDVALGIQRAIEKGANVINLSLSSDHDARYLHELISAYHDQGVLFLAAAGNEPVTTSMYPAAYSEVLAVSAGNQQGQFAPYANRGGFIDLVLPGSGLVPFGGDQWMVSGTSTATAYASGIAGALWNPALGSPATLESTLRSNFGLRKP